jgi:hypothetical protein
LKAKTLIIIWIFVDILILCLLSGLIFFVKEKMIIDYIKIAITFMMILFFNAVFFSLRRK